MTTKHGKLLTSTFYLLVLLLNPISSHANEYKGILVWNEQVNYPIYSEAVGSDGVVYRALLENGPNSDEGSVDPTTSSEVWQEKRAVLSVGQTLFLLVSDTPEELGYSGEWEQLEADISISSVPQLDSNIGVVTGENNVLVPLVEHAHNASSTFVGEALPPHSHTQTFGATTSAGGQPHGFDGGDQIRPNASTHSASAGTPTGTVLTTIEAAGEPQPTINVQGRVLNGVLWKRIR